MGAQWRMAAWVLLACGVTAAAPAPEAELTRAREVARLVQQGTRALLEEQLRTAGPAGALTACSQVALQLATQHEQEGGRVRRVSLRVRNPADAPDPWERRQLTALAREHARAPLAAGTERVEVVRRGEGRVLRYLTPVIIPQDGPCLRCHGDRAALEPGVRAAIDSLYPRDRAVGYRAGDLRGAVSVTLPLAGR